MIKEITGKHVVFFFIAFFGIIFTVNGYMIYKSQSSWTGLETHDAYRKGLKYNQKLSASSAQNTRDWTMDLTRKELADGGFELTAIPKDKNNEGLSALNMKASLVRPTHEGIDREFPLKETGLGVYTGTIGKIPLGKWYLLVTASRNGQVLYRSKNELYLR